MQVGHRLRTSLSRQSTHPSQERPKALSLRRGLGESESELGEAIRAGLLVRGTTSFLLRLLKTWSDKCSGSLGVSFEPTQQAGMFKDILGSKRPF